MKFSLLQLNSRPGDLRRNADEIVKLTLDQAQKGSSLCITPRLALTGSISKDYLQYPFFISNTEKAIQDIAQKTCRSGAALLLGGIGRNEKGAALEKAFFIYNGKISGTFDKLVDSDVNEISADSCFLLFREKKFLVTLGDDYKFCALSREAGQFEVLINMSADVFVLENQGEKKRELERIGMSAEADIIYVNSVGANDGEIYCGGSFWRNVLGAEVDAPLFEPEVIEIDSKIEIKSSSGPIFNEQELILNALIAGVRDYCAKIGTHRIIIGLSGGIDSSLTAVIAAFAVGSKNVLGVLMPSPWSSDHSVADAKNLAENLDVATLLIPIAEPFAAYGHILSDSFKGLQEDVTEENLQARIRGDIVMALANKFRGIVLATSNKSEISVGYFTLYGDSCGALEVIGDLYKTEVYKLCSWINDQYGGLIPQNILLKAPSAELRPGQKDEDSLPPYPELDGILKGLLDERLDPSELETKGFKRETIAKIADLAAKAQFKRFQTAPTLKVHAPTHLNFPISGVMPFKY